jgi:hypothetical protein
MYDIRHYIGQPTIVDPASLNEGTRKKQKTFPHILMTMVE